MKKLMRRLWANEEGQGMVEYALILALIAVVLILTLTNLGSGIKAKFEEIITKMPASSS